MTRYPTRSLLSTACAVVLGTLPALSQASGFAVPEISIAGLGLSNAVVANRQEHGAVAYNPALAVFHDGLVATGGLMLVRPTLEVTTTNGNFESQGKENVLIPNFQVTYAYNDKITLGIGANAPFGLETDWPTGTFPVLAAAFGGALQPTTSRLETVVVSPTVSARLSDQASISAGVDYYRVNEVVFNAAGGTNEGDGDGWGWNISGAYAQGPWTFGVSYHSKATVDVTGTSTTITPATAKATADVPFPWRLQAGVHYQASDRLGVEFDITRTGWSEFDTLVINGVSTTTSVNNWDDANAYRLGVSYQLDGKTRLRFGYTFDQTGQNDEHYSARIPDADRHLFSIGVGHEVSKGLMLDAGYMYVKFNDRNYNSGTALASADPNGTSAYNGNYEANVHLFGVGLTKQF